MPLAVQVDCAEQAVPCARARDALQLQARQSSKQWSEAERKAFMELFLQHPKEFRTISSALPGNRSQGDCVAFFYKHQKLDEWANVRRKQQLKKRKVRGWCGPECTVWRAFKHWE